MRCVLQQRNLANARGSSARHIRQGIDGLERKTFLDQICQVVTRSAEGDRISAVDERIRDLAAVAADHRLLIDVEFFEKVLAELSVESGGIVASGSRCRRIMRDDLALPLRIEQVLGIDDLSRLDQPGVDEKQGAEGVEEPQDVLLLRV